VSDAPAGWYPDPTPASATPALRYWDGQQWTEHVAPALQPAAPYAAPYAAQPSGPTTPDGVPLAGWGWRFLAYLIDMIPGGILGAIVGLPAQIRLQERLQDLSVTSADGTLDMDRFWTVYREGLHDIALWQLPVYVVVLAYFILMLRFKGATLGKLAVGLRVRRVDGDGQLPWSTAIVRTLAFLGIGYLTSLTFLTGSFALMLLVGSAVSVYVLLDVLWPLWDSKRQALHDKVARTNVVKVR
jgi:uncharacterized RDD family membrane protein YckC